MLVRFLGEIKEEPKVDSKGYLAVGDMTRIVEGQSYWRRCLHLRWEGLVPVAGQFFWEIY